MPNDFIDLNVPRYRLPVDELPRGLVRFPEHIVDHLKQEQARLGFRFAADYARESLERQTLAYYHEGIPVAYRAAPDGIEVLAVGWGEVARYWQTPEPGIKVVQP